MTPNPLHRFRHRETKLPFDASEWSPPRSWSVPRAEGEPLVFQLRLPSDVELVDIPSLAEAGPAVVAVVGTDSPKEGQVPGATALTVVGRAAVELGQSAGPAGLVLLGALRPSDVPEAERQILATLTVVLAEQIKGPPSEGNFRVPGSKQAIKSSHTALKVSDQAMLITGANMESPGEGTDPILMMYEQYLFETRYGALMMAFCTANEQGMPGQAGRLYMRIAETGFLGERAPSS
jgi:hypothetical protein